MSEVIEIGPASGGTTTVRTAQAGPRYASPARIVAVDASFDVLAPPAFAETGAAILHARALVAEAGGRVLVRLYHGADGEPLTADALDVAALRAEGVDVEQAGVPGSAGGGFIDLLLTGSLDVPTMTYDLDVARMGVDVQLSIEPIQ